MNIIVNSLRHKIYLRSILRNFIFFWSKKERKYEKFVRKIGAIDSIQEYGVFFNAIQEVLFSKKLQQSRRNGTEAQHYGHYDALISYGNFQSHAIPLIPAMEHGIRFSSQNWNYRETCLCYACQGKKRINEIHNIDPWKPVFYMGPYIHYAEGYYSKDKFLRVKEKFGKTLLVFPSHTFEQSTIEREDDFVNLVYKKYAKDFDSVMVCVYWHDANDIVMGKFREKGAKLVSAGFRGDNNFIKRLKTIIQLSDAVVADEIGTNIGYCVYMGKPVYLEGEQKIGLTDRDYTDNYQSFKKAFFSDTLSFTEKQKEMQEMLYKEFWGGEECIRSKEEVGIIFKLLEEIYNLAHYDTRRVPIVIQDKLEEWKYSNKKADVIKYHILKGAVML